MIKDEADIIELFIRINSRVIDHFFIVDNGSTDNTVKILEKMIQEGYRITLYNDPNPNYDQAEMTTKALRSATSSTQYDWAFILDADEFVNIKKEELEKELGNIPPTSSQVASLKWSTWIPKGDVYYKYSNPLYSCFNRKKEETENYEKVIVPYYLAKGVLIDMGNHNAYLSMKDSYALYDARKLHAKQLTCGVLDHVPVRSSAQIATKIIIGSIKLSLKKDRGIHEGYHWDHANKLIKENGYKVDDLLLRYLALVYLAKPGKEILDNYDKSDKLGLETDKVKYKSLYKFNDMARIYNFMVSLRNRIKDYK